MAAMFVTGGSGFLGSLLLSRLLDDGHAVTSIDLVPCEIVHPRLTAVIGDIRNRSLLDRLFASEPPQAIFHCASLLAHGRIDAGELWSSNVEGARTLAAAVAATPNRPTVVYTSSNCLWGVGFDRPVTEDDAPAPIEIYGRSKWEGEKVLHDPANPFPTVSIRCPTIMDEGRLGLLSILFEFISEGRRVWMVGSGANRYQFVSAQDLIEAMLMAARAPRSAVYGIGSDAVPTMRETYQHVIDQTGSRARVMTLPQGPTVAAMKAAHLLRVSPLGPYHYRMIASDFMFDTSRIKAELGWRPTLSNRDMMLRAYRYYRAHKAEIYSRTVASAHRKPAGMGVIRLVKWVS